MANWSPDRQQALQARVERLIVESDYGVMRGIKGVWNIDSLKPERLAELRQRHEREFVYASDFDETLAAKDAEIARLTTRSDEGHAAHAASFDALLKIAVVVQDGEVDSYDSLADKTIALLDRQQADLTRLAEVEKQVAADLAIFMGDIPPDAKFSMEAVAAWYRLRGVIERSEDAKEAARE